MKIFIARMPKSIGQESIDSYNKSLKTFTLLKGLKSKCVGSTKLYGEWHEKMETAKRDLRLNDPRELLLYYEEVPEFVIDKLGFYFEEGHKKLGVADIRMLVNSLRTVRDNHDFAAYLFPTAIFLNEKFFENVGTALDKFEPIEEILNDGDSLEMFVYKDKPKSFSYSTYNSK